MKRHMKPRHFIEKYFKFHNNTTFSIEIYEKKSYIHIQTRCRCILIIINFVKGQVIVKYLKETFS